MSQTTLISPENFDEFLPWACRQFETDYEVVVFSEVQDMHTSHRPSLKKGTVGPVAETKGSQDALSEYNVKLHDSLTRKLLKVTTSYDTSGNLIQLRFDSRRIPRHFLKIIELTVTYHEHLNNITITQGLISESLYQLGKLLPLTSITEICLDRSNVPNADYGILLENENLIHLSLCRCKIDADMVKLIANKFAFPLPASKSLTILNLASNKIGDTGAKYLASALKYNRRLAFLNISDNSITDEGASVIFNILKECVVTDEELVTFKKRNFVACKEKLQSQTIEDLDKAQMLKKKNVKGKLPPSMPVSKKKTAEKDTQTSHKEKICFDIDTDNPLSPHNKVIKNGKVHFAGNNTLAYLNISYNHLSFISVNKLLTVLLYQQELDRTPRGLVNVRIEGNCIPSNCAELHEVNQILLDFLTQLVSAPVKKKSKSERTTLTANK